MACGLDTRPDLADIEAAIKAETVRAVAARFGVSKSMVGNHRACMGLARIKVVQAPEEDTETPKTTDDAGRADASIHDRLSKLETSLATKAAGVWRRLKKKRPSMRDFVDLTVLQLRSISLQIRAARELGSGMGEKLGEGVAEDLEKKVARLRMRVISGGGQ